MFDVYCFNIFIVMVLIVAAAPLKKSKKLLEINLVSLFTCKFILCFIEQY